MKLLSREALLRSALFSAAICNPYLTRPLPALADSVTTATLDQGSGIKFQADDLSFEFVLPQGWTPATPADQERAAPSHLIAVSAVQGGGGSATVRAVVEGGSRGRKYGTKLGDLGSLDETADRLVLKELLNDDAAKDAAITSKERTSFKGSSYYVIKYAVGSKVTRNRTGQSASSPMLRVKRWAVVGYRPHVVVTSQSWRA